MTFRSAAAGELGGITVNGSPEPHGTATVAALLVSHDIDTAGRGIAVALNGRVVPRAAWTNTPITPGDAVEIVRARPGG
jgi:sulfur carrier protein